MKEVHERILGEHYVFEKTLQKNKKRHEWDHMAKYVEEYITHYETCQRNKNTQKRMYQYTSPDIPSKPNEKISIDLRDYKVRKPTYLSSFGLPNEIFDYRTYNRLKFGSSNPSALDCIFKDSRETKNHFNW